MEKREGAGTTWAKENKRGSGAEGPETNIVVGNRGTRKEKDDDERLDK